MDSIAPRLKKIAKAHEAAQIIPAEFVAPKASTARKATAKLIAKAIPNLSTQAKAFDAVVAKHMKEGDAALKKARAGAIKDSRGQKTAIAHLAAQKVKAYEVLSAVNVPGTQYHLLNTPFEISSSAGMPLTSSAIVPSNSSAKFKLHVEDGPDVTNTASFKYVWVNPSEKYVVVNVHGYIIFRGHVQYGVGGGFFGGDRNITVSVNGRLEIFDLSNPDPVSVPPVADQSVNVYYAHEDQGDWFSVGAVGAKDIFRGYDLSHELLVVPPHATMGFNMTAAFTCNTGDDESLIDLDFASGNFQLGSPAVLLAIVS